MKMEQENKYKVVFDKNPAGLYSISLDGIILDCNFSFATMMGFDSPEELKGTNVIHLYSEPELRNDFLQKITELKEINNYEIVLRRKNGEVIVCLENSFLLEEANQPQTISGAIIQITGERILAEKYASLFRSSEDGIMFFENGRLVDVNDRLVDLVDFKREELMSFETEQVLLHIKKTNPESFELLELKIDKAKQGLQQHIRLKIERKDQSVFHAKVSLYPFNSLFNRHTQVTITDISERILFEQTIKESEARFRTLSKVAREGIVFVHDNIIIDCNNQILTMLGFESNKDLIGKNLEDFILHPDMRRLKSTLQASKTLRTEIRAINTAGKIIHMEGSGTEISGDNMKMEAYLLYDITGRKRIENELERSREQFKSLVENSPNGVWIVVDNQVRYVNSSGLKTLGYEDEDEVFNIPFTSLTEKTTQQEVLKDFTGIRSGKDVDFKEINMLHKNGSTVAVSMNMTLSIYEHEPAIQVTLNNLTLERQLIEQRLRAEMAEGVNKELKKEITNHKETQRKLLAAERFTRNIIDSSIDMIIAVDPLSRITEFNPAALESFGYNSEEITGSKADILYADERAYKRILVNLQKTGVFSGEILNKRKDGSTFTSLLSASLIKNEQGEILGSMGVSRDITEFKQAQERIRESEERLRDIFNNATDFILSFDNQGYITYANPSFINSIGFSPDELKRTNIRQLTENKRIIASGNLMDLFGEDDFKATLLTASGEKIHVSGNTSIRHTDSVPTGVRAILRNVTRETVQSAKLNSIFESTENLHMWTLDREYKLTGSNKNFLFVLQSQFGLELKVGENYVEAVQGTINPDLYQNQLIAFKQAFDGRAQNFELPLLTKTGENSWYQVFLNPVYIEDELQEISCIAYDITDRKIIDRKIRDALKEKEVLLKEVHHRVKNNLQVISSILSLQTGYVTDEKTLDVLRESQNRIKSMSYIHETLYQTADFSSIEFSEYINVIAKNLTQSYTISSGRVKLETNFDRISLSLDQAIPCGLIVNELISNALKHAFHGEKNPVLSVSIKESEGKIALSVSDNGVGLPKDFDYRNYNSLGVQLVYTLAEQLDAEVEVKSGKGTTFLVTFEQVIQE